MEAGMITGHVFIATSLDGFIARDDGDIGWLLERDSAGEDHGYDAFIKDIDAIVMGRGCFDGIRQMTPWPYGLPVVVMSKSLKDQPLPEALAGKVAVSDQSPAEVMAGLALQGHRRVYVDGGQIIQSFLRAGLIADMVITQVPVLLGQGRALFGALGADVALVHEQSRSFASGLVQSRYRIAG
jgi:dihydrofolate reductase